MKTRAAVLWNTQEAFSIEEIDLDGPKEGEVLVRWSVAGLCHSDEHVRTGDMPTALPIVAGHEGAGVVEEVGASVRTLKAGDHVVGAFLPACGRCRWCSTGHQNLCDLGAELLAGTMLDGTHRRRARGQDIAALSMLGTFGELSTVPEASLVKIDNHYPLAQAAMVGCGVTTGWGSAVNSARVAPGDTVVVIGCGGIGSGAIQGARIAGAQHIVAVDLAEGKKDRLLELGATHFVTSTEEATELVRDLTRGVMADAAILTVGVLSGEHIGQALEMIRKGGSTVVTAAAPFSATTATLPMAMFTMFQKRLVGSLYGEANPRADIPRLLRLYETGQLMLDETITAEYPLEQINTGYQDMYAGKNIRGIIRHA